MKVIFKSLILGMFLSCCSNNSNSDIESIQTQAARELASDSTELAVKVQTAYPLKKNSKWQAIYEDLDCSGLPELFSVVIDDSVVSMRMTTVDTTVTICSASGKFDGILDIKKYVSESGGFLFVNTTSKQCIIVRQRNNVTESVDLVNGVVASNICAINPLTIDKIENDIIYADFDCQDAIMKDSLMTGCVTYAGVPFFIEDGMLKECEGIQQIDITHYYGVEKVMSKIKDDGGKYTHSVKCDVKGKETFLFVNYEVEKSGHIEYYYIKCKTHLHYLTPEYGMNEAVIAHPGNRKVSYIELIKRI